MHKKLLLAGLLSLEAILFYSYKNQKGGVDSDDDMDISDDDMSPEDRLLSGAYDGDYNDVNGALEEKVDINVTDNGGYTALMLSSMHYDNDPTIIRLLLDYNPDIDAISNNGSTALYLAIVNNNNEMADILLDSGADVNIQVTNDPDRIRNALEAAVAHRQILLVRKIINKGVNLQHLENALDLARRTDANIHTLLQNEINRQRTILTETNRVLTGNTPHDYSDLAKIVLDYSK